MPKSNLRGVTLATVGLAILAIGWIVPIPAPGADYLAFAGWALGAVGTVLHFRDNNAPGEGLE